MLLTDLFMPEQDGLETIQSFRARFPEMRIIAMSGDAHIRFKTDFLAVAREAGAAGTIFNIVQYPSLNHRIACEAGLMGEECGGMLRAFFQGRR